MSRRKLAWFLAILAFFIFVGLPFQHQAHAIALEGSLIAIIIAALAALGITFTTTGGFQNLESYVTSLMYECASDYNTTLDTQLRGAQTGSNALGQILLNNRMVLYIDTFAKWLKMHFSLADNAHYDVVVPGTSLGSLHGYTLPLTIVSDDMIWIYTVESVDATDEVALFFERPTGAGSWAVRGISKGTASIKMIEISSNGATFTNTKQLNATVSVWHWNYPSAFYISKDRYDDSNVLYGYLESEIRNAMQSNSSLVNTPHGIIVNTGDITFPTDDDNYAEGDGAILNMDNPWGLTYDETTNTIPDEYQETEIEYQTEQEIQDQLTGTPAQSISDNPGEYQTPGLQSVFPFCIPFDIYAFFECLAADPVAPVFTWRFYVPDICDETFTVDLSVFNSVAQIVRTMELLAFIVGLAVVTRDKFLRG